MHRPPQNAGAFFYRSVFYKEKVLAKPNYSFEKRKKEMAKKKKKEEKKQRKLEKQNNAKGEKGNPLLQED